MLNCGIIDRRMRKKGEYALKLKTKVIIAFFAMTILPISVMFMSFYAFTYLQMQDIQNAYGVEVEGYESLSNSAQLLSKLTTDVYVQVLDTTERDPGALGDHSYQNRINSVLKDQSSYLIVRKEDELIFKGNVEKSDRIQSYLPPYGSNGRDMNGSKYVAPEKSLVRAIDFIFADGTSGTVFIVTDIDEMIPQLQELLFLAIAAIVVIVIVTALVIMIWIYRSIVNPIHRLQKAVHEIQQGNLEFEITTTRKEKKTEIGQLCEDFDEMRSRLKQSNEDKEKYNQESRELIANISHDLKTPITSVKGYIEGIRDGVADTPEKMERYLTIIYNKAIDMDRLISELNIYSKIDTNKIQYSFQFLNISGYFSDCVEEVGMDLQSKNIELAFYDYTDGQLQVKADPEQLKRVVNNIIGNSVKYMDKEKGFISISLKDMGEVVQIEIEDNGKGIAQEDIPRIFERFYRTDASRNSAQGGSGIGLSIVKKIIEDHKGKLWASSKEKKGTTIYFSLKTYSEEDKHE